MPKVPIYQICFCTGVIGFMALSLMGAMHGHGGHHTGHARGGGHHSGHGGRAHVPAKAMHLKGGQGAGPTAGSWFLHWAQSAGWMLLSPVDIFAFLAGFGLSGMSALHITTYHPFVLLLAVAGGLVFDLAVLRPLIGLLFRAAAPPSEGLEGTVTQIATAETAFDQAGRGLVKLTLDGQIVQLLGTVDAKELEGGVKVHKGDPLLILEVDPKRNVCRVSRDLAN